MTDQPDQQPEREPRHLVFVDVETNGLDRYRHVAVEVAWWNLTTDVRGYFVPQHDVHHVLGTADVAALRVNHYIDRLATAEQAKPAQVLELWEQFAGSAVSLGDAVGVERPARHTFVAANPAFDAHHIRNVFRVLEEPFGIDDVEPWHFRLWDVEAYAVGVLGLDEIPGLSSIARLLGIEPGNHTAQDDVTTGGLCMHRLMEINRERLGGAQ